MQIYTGLIYRGPELVARMRIGLPREIKDGEFRVALTPAGVGELVRAGHEVIVEPGSGSWRRVFRSKNIIEAERKAGNPWDCELVVKVKELQEAEYRLPRQGQTVFSFQHFGPEPALLDAALASGATFIAFETVGQADGSLPILAPMSAIAGRLAVQVGAWCLQKHNGGSGVLLPGARRRAAGQGRDPRRGQRRLERACGRAWNGRRGRRCLRKARRRLPRIQKDVSRREIQKSTDFKTHSDPPISSSAAS